MTAFSATELAGRLVHTRKRTPVLPLKLGAVP
jgi:hypothetical protein